MSFKSRVQRWTCSFRGAKLPPIYQAVRVVSDGFTVPSPINVILEVQQHLGEGRVRCIAMSATDGMVRGMKAIDQGGPNLRARGPRHAGARDERDRRAGRPTGPGRIHEEECRFIASAPAFDEQATTPRCLRPA
jgi:F-type H+/Na+-transporting ATPase subunit beta